jgi:DNA-binding XRE family transcriptional regulator
MSVQFIKNNGVKQYAIIPADTYALLLEKAEMLDDVRAYDEAMASDDESIPSEIVDRLLSGESKLKVWREYRNLSQAELAEKCGVAQASISQIESGDRVGSITLLKKIASMLKLDVDDLI